MKGYTRQGITLIELLVAIAILAALAAILFPVLARARENTRRTTCMSNMRQIGLGIQMYRQDWGGVDPEKGKRLSCAEMGLPIGDTSLTVLVRQYVRNKQVWFCPSATIDRPDLGSTYNGLYLCNESNYPWLDFRELTALRGPDYPLLVCESHNGPKVPIHYRDAEEPMRYHVLRIDLRVDVRILRADYDIFIGDI